MQQKISASDVYRWLEEDFKRRPELGLCNAALNLALEPRNPFEPEARRKPKPWFVIAMFLILAGIGTFAYFNFGALR
jgi:hypothetical protein